MEHPTLTSAQEIARAFDRSVATVYVWFKEGCPKPPTTKAGVASWRKARQESLKKRRAARRVGTRESVNGESEEWATRLRKARALKEELNLAARRGELVEREDVARLFAERVVTVRHSLMLLPRRVAPEFPEVQVRLMKKLDEEIRAICEEYARPADILEPTEEENDHDQV